MRRHVEPVVLPDNTEEVELLNAKLDSLKEHIRSVSNTLLDAINPENESIPVSQNDKDQSFSSVLKRNPRNASKTKNQLRPEALVTSAPNSTPPTNVTDQQLRPEVLVIGTSLTRGVGKQLRLHDLDATAYTYPGAEIPLIKQRVKHVISQDKPPQHIVIQAGGNDAENHAVPLVINEYDALIKEVERNAPNANIILNKIPHRSFNKRTHHSIDKINIYLGNRARRSSNVKFVDACPSFPDYFKSDLIHFDNDGCEKYGSKLAYEIKNFHTNHANTHR